MVKNCLLLLAAMFVSSFSIKAQTTIADSFKVAGVYRSYRLYVPASFKTAARPLVLNMHGFTSNALQQEFYSGFDAVADTAGIYVVYPQGSYAQGVAFWDVDYPGSPSVPDVQFLSGLIDTLAARYPVDRARVYATGFSNGGYMSHILGIRLSNKIAAIASVSGTMVQSVAASNPGRAVPAMHIHGTADGTVAYAGDGTSVSVDSVVAFWVRNNGCNAAPMQTAVPNISASDGCTADHFVWTGGRNGSTVELYRVNGGAHSWPGAPPVVGVTNQDFSASREIWRFFSQYKLDAATGVGKISAASGLALQLSPNPAKDILQVEAEGKGIVTIRDIAGKTLMQATGKTLDISGLPAGYFLVEFNNRFAKGSASFVKE